jgi:hypothetical protein
MIGELRRLRWPGFPGRNHLDQASQLPGMAGSSARPHPSPSSFLSARERGGRRLSGRPRPSRSGGRCRFFPLPFEARAADRKQRQEQGDDLGGPVRGPQNRVWTRGGGRNQICAISFHLLP